MLVLSQKGDWIGQHLAAESMPVPSVLIVDDDPDTCAGMADVLTDLGYPVDIALGGALALQALEQQEYRLVLLDYRLPDLDGLAVYRWARRKQPDVVGVVVTASALDDLAEQARATGIERVLSKPVDFGKLIPLIEGILGKNFA